MEGRRLEDCCFCLYTISQLHCFFMACEDSVVKCFELNSGPAIEGPVYALATSSSEGLFFSTLMV